MTKQTPHMKPKTHKNRRTATKGPPWNAQYENYSLPLSLSLSVCVRAHGRVVKPVLLAQNLALNSHAAPKLQTYVWSTKRSAPSRRITYKQKQRAQRRSEA